MTASRSTPPQTGSKKALWAAVAVVMVIVLAMGATLIRIQTQAPEPRLVVLPAMEAPPAIAASAVASASNEAASSAATLPPASAAVDPRLATNKPRIVHPRTSEPAVARAPERISSKPDAVEAGPQPGVKP